MYAGFSGYVCVLVCNGCINCRHCRAIFRKLTPFPFGYPDTSDWCGSTVASSRMADCVFALGGNVLWSEFPVFPSQPSAEVSVSGESRPLLLSWKKMIQERSAPMVQDLPSYHLIILMTNCGFESLRSFLQLIGIQRRLMPRPVLGHFCCPPAKVRKSIKKYRWLVLHDQQKWWKNNIYLMHLIHWFSSYVLFVDI